jgi:hypothetical protein
MTTTTQEKYELTITADNIISTDTRFNIDNLNLGDNYEPIDAYYVTSDNELIRRKRNKGEQRISNQTLPRLAMQIFERQLVALSEEDKKNFPVCKYSPGQALIRGIFSSVEEYRDYKKSVEYLIYRREAGPQFVIYSWNMFSTLNFVQECVKRFGKRGEKFVLIYRDKTEKKKTEDQVEKIIIDDTVKTLIECKIPYSRILLESKNLIFRGAPGTGKSYLAKQIAADIISNGYTDKWADLTEEQRRQVEFVQFHPSYDYSDFVEGLRPKMNEDGSMGFELQDGIFKSFVDRARRNFEDSQKPKEVREKEVSSNTALEEFLADIELGEDEFKTVMGRKFNITDVDDKHIYLEILGNGTENKIFLKIDELRKMLESGKNFEKVRDVTRFFGIKFTQQVFSYYFVLFKAIKAAGKTNRKAKVEEEPLKKYIFIIDEINRGEISKILGELFFAIDPGYRGQAGEVATQYSNMHVNPDEKFYIPENVYIIGTMNDIDRSVDSFDFAMRRRFRFVEVRAESTQDMLDTIADEDIKNEAIARMDRLNAEILTVEGLNENYQIGASYFLKLKYLKFADFWTDYLEPLLQEYVRGLYDEKGIMKRFARAYGYSALDEGTTDEAAEN